MSAKVEEIRVYGKIPSQIPLPSVVKNAKLSLVNRDWVLKNKLDAFSVQCWSSIQLNYGCATCTVMSMMGEKLTPGAREVDIAGAISMYAFALEAGALSALLDWNNNFGDDRDMCVCTHCGNFPKGFVGGEIEISELRGNSMPSTAIGQLSGCGSESSEPTTVVLCRTVMETGKTMRRAPSSLFVIRSRRSFTTVLLISAFGWQIVDRDGIE